MVERNLIGVPRHYSRAMARGRGPRPFVKTFKKIINSAQASVTSGNNIEILATGVDAISPKQTTATDTDVPTGSRIRYMEIQFAAVNLLTGAAMLNVSIQYKLSGQSFVDPNLAGGHAQRNQIMHQVMYSAGPDQNASRIFKFKVPSKFQRLKEGMVWGLVWNGSGTVTRIVQTIYKFES